MNWSTVSEWTRNDILLKPLETLPSTTLILFQLTAHQTGCPAIQLS